ncbi:MAG: hypothetical protein IPK07_25650 [Deltaproteobacteria bacterium]|nr:hypothetical protein [Deltaproteobacteria bacterium]
MSDPRAARAAAMPAAAPGASRRAAAFAGPAVGLALALWSWMLGRAMAGPIVFHDELAPVAWARYLRHGTPMPLIGVPFYPAYGALLALVSPDVLDPDAAHVAARVLNALLCGVTGWAAVGLARVLLGPRASARACVAVALAASLHAPVVLYGHLAIADNALFAGSAVALLVLARALREPNVERMTGAGLILGCLPLIHVRAVAVVIGAALGVGAWLVARARRGSAVPVRTWVPLALAVTIGLVLAWLGARWASVVPPLPLDRMARAHRLERIAGRGLGHFGARLPCVLAGQALYLGLSTFGVAWLAIREAWLRGRAALAREPSRDGTDAAPVAALELAVVASVLATWAMSSLFFNTGMRRLDQALNGRYLEALAVPLLAVGFAAVWRGERRAGKAALRVALGAGLVTASLGAVATQVGRFVPLDHGFNPVTVLALHPWLGDAALPSVWRLTAIGAATAALGAGLAVARPRAALAAWIGWSLVSAVWISRGYLVPGSRARAEERVVVDALTVLDRGGEVPACIGLDYPSWSLWHAHSYSFRRAGQRFELFDSGAGGAPCSELVVSANRELAAVYPGARVVARETSDADRLWVLPGALQARLAAAGRVEPQSWGVLPRDAARSELGWAGVDAARRLRVTHRGGVSPWLGRAELGRVEGAIRVGLRWYRAGEAGRPVGESRIDLPHALLPGGVIELALSVPPSDLALAPGDYHVAIGLLQEGVRWFHDTGDGVLETDVSISAR